MTKSKAVWMLLALGAAAFPLNSQALDTRFALVAGYDTGGDKIVDIPIVGGGSDSIRANEGLYVGAGISLLTDEKNLEFLGTVNYKFASISANNGDVDWTRMPIDALLFYRWEKFRVGGGLTYHLNPKLKGSGVASNINVTFDNPIGGLIQADFLFQKVSIGLRYTLLEYKKGSASAKSDGVGLTFGITF